MAIPSNQTTYAAQKAAYNQQHAVDEEQARMATAAAQPAGSAAATYPGLVPGDTRSNGLLLSGGLGGGPASRPVLNPASSNVGLGGLYLNTINTNPSQVATNDVGTARSLAAAQAALGGPSRAVPGGVTLPGAGAPIGGTSALPALAAGRSKSSLLFGPHPSVAGLGAQVYQGAPTLGHPTSTLGGPVPATAGATAPTVVHAPVRDASVLSGAGAPVAGQQTDLSHLLMDASGHGGPSAAEGALLTASHNNIGALAAMAANVRGGNAATAGHSAGVQGADQALATQAQVGALRATETQAARDQLRQLLSGQREQDLTGQRDTNTATATARQQDVQNFVAQNNAAQGLGQLGVNAFTAQSNAGLEARKLDDAATQNAIANFMGMSVDDVNFQNMDNNTKLAIANYLQANKGMELGYTVNQRNADANMIQAVTAPIGGVASAGGAAAATLLK